MYLQRLCDYQVKVSIAAAAESHDTAAAAECEGQLYITLHGSSTDSEELLLKSTGE